MPATNPTSPSIHSMSADSKRQHQKEAQPRIARSLAIRCARQALITKTPIRFISFALSLLPILTHNVPAAAAPEAPVAERAVAAVAQAELVAREVLAVVGAAPEAPVAQVEPERAAAAVAPVAPGLEEVVAQPAVARPAAAEAQTVVIVAATPAATTTTIL